ncbi:hypothetical protein [Paramuribaculum intestinale]|nr:hypothetical protein [Paramuribaculum intestinale]
MSNDTRDIFSGLKARIKELPDEKFFAMQSAKAMMASEANQLAR